MRVDAGAPPQTNDNVPLVAQVFCAFLRLGLTSFGGPIAHLGYFNVEFVRRRKWLDEDAFAQVVALCQFLPGPASSQVAMIIGLMRAGASGAAAAWLAFTLPSAIVMVAVAFGIARVPNARTNEWLHGLLIAAVAIVAVAVANMYRSLCPDVRRKSVALIAAAIVLCVPASGFVQLALVAAGAVYGRLFVRPAQRKTPTQVLPIGGSPAIATLCALLFLALLIGPPLIGRLGDDGPLAVFAAFYASGALVFGGGHVVLPMLAARIVSPGWISPDAFLAGYGAAQAVPGPLFTFAAYLGAAMHGPVTGIGGACLALTAIYLPSFLLILAIVPFWNRLQRNDAVVAAMSGVNAVVVGLLLAALYQPVWVNAIHAPADVALALLAFALLDVLRWQPWLVVISSALASFALGNLRHV
jgi:chromate transporter